MTKTKEGIKINVHIAVSLSIALWFIPLLASSEEFKQSASISFTDTAWGPYAAIVIEYMPSAEDAVATFGDPAALARLAEQSQAEAEKDRTVVIDIPNLDYGVTGSFENLRIVSGEGISVTPTGRLGSRYTPTRKYFTGKAVILEFTKELLTGSYDAELYLEKGTRSGGPATKRDYVGHVAGEFTIINPALDDLRIEPEPLAVEPGADVLIQRLHELNVPPQSQAMLIEMLKDLSPEQQEMFLQHYNDSY